MIEPAPHEMPGTVQSADGTTIAYEHAGVGPSLILVGGAFNTRQSGYALSDLLVSSFDVYVYDRRGRGDSTDTAPYAVERELEDLAALIEAAGGTVYVYGHSSGAILALEAASTGLAIARLAVYEPPYTFDPDYFDPYDSVPAGDGGVQAALDADDRERATEAFMRLTGMDDQAVAWAKQAPFWPGMLAIAHTAAYDLAITGDGKVPAERLAEIAAPTLVMNGGTSPAWASRAAEGVAAAIPGARRSAIEGADHGVAAEVLAPLLLEFFG
jgi:pimeloyl-ACP methyl ester carboxylesterase